MLRSLIKEIKSLIITQQCRDFITVFGKILPYKARESSIQKDSDLWKEGL